MNIFIAGVHGVGKTFLATQIPSDLGLCHMSASTLIREELAMPNWGADKRVSDINRNQIALASAVKRYNDTGTNLLLDGHFVLLDRKGELSHLSVAVFEPLRLRAVILLETQPDIVAQRLYERDGHEHDVIKLAEFITAERLQAQLICKELELELHILMAPTSKIFVEAVSNIMR